MSAAHQSQAEAPPAGPRQHTAQGALVPVKVNGWTLFTIDEGGHWILDLDLARRAGLGDIHKIRGTITKAIKDGALTEVVGIEPHGERFNDLPCYRQVTTVSVSGKGRSREVPEYYLNEAGALLILIRLRTAAAIAISRAVVRVFIAVSRGAHVNPDVMRRLGDMEAHADLDRQEILLLRAKVDLLDPDSDGLCGEARADLIKRMLVTAARQYCETMGTGSVQAQTKERDNELRGHVEHVQGIEQTWAHLPLSKFGKAMAKLYEMVGREKKRARNLAPVSEQLRLPTKPSKTARAA